MKLDGNGIYLLDYFLENDEKNLAFASVVHTTDLLSIIYKLYKQKKVKHQEPTPWGYTTAIKITCYNSFLRNPIARLVSK